MSASSFQAMSPIGCRFIFSRNLGPPLEPAIITLPNSETPMPISSCRSCRRIKSFVFEQDNRRSRLDLKIYSPANSVSRSTGPTALNSAVNGERDIGIFLLLHSG